MGRTYPFGDVRKSVCGWRARRSVGLPGGRTLGASCLVYTSL